MPYFPAINSAAHYTVEYFHIGRIADQINKMAGRSNFSYLDTYYEMVFDWHQIMETEIDQHIHGSTDNLQNQYFEHLRTTLDIVNTWGDYDILIAIDTYNEKAEKKFHKEIEEKVEIFRKSEEFLTRAHKEEWEDYPPDSPFLPLSFNRVFKTKRIHYKWFQVHGGPEVLDISFIPEYLEYVRRITDNFKRITNSALKLWDDKKIKSNASTSFQIIQPPSQPLLNQPQSELPGVKLKTNLTAGQILYLFKTLNSLEIFGKISNVDLCRFIASSISTKGKEELSADNLAKVWSNISPNDIAYWGDKFPEMSKQVLKDNPNKIKYKELDSK